MKTHVNAPVVWVFKVKSGFPRLHVFVIQTTSLIQTGLDTGLFGLVRFYCTRNLPAHNNIVTLYKLTSVDIDCLFSVSGSGVRVGCQGRV